MCVLFQLWMQGAEGLLASPKVAVRVMRQQKKLSDHPVAEVERYVGVGVDVHELGRGEDRVFRHHLTTLQVLTR